MVDGVRPRNMAFVPGRIGLCWGDNTGIKDGTPSSSEGATTIATNHDSEEDPKCRKPDLPPILLHLARQKPVMTRRWAEVERSPEAVTCAALETILLYQCDSRGAEDDPLILIGATNRNARDIIAKASWIETCSRVRDYWQELYERDWQHLHWLRTHAAGAERILSMGHILPWHELVWRAEQILRRRWLSRKIKKARDYLLNSVSSERPEEEAPWLLVWDTLDAVKMLILTLAVIPEVLADMLEVDYETVAYSLN